MNYQSPPLTDALPKQRSFVVSISKWITNLLLGLLIAIPTLTYYDDVSLFELGGIEFNVRFLLLLVSFCITLLGLLYIRKIRIHLLFLLIIGFAFWGSFTALIQSVSIRWWLPPLLRLTTSGLLGIWAYNLAFTERLSTARFQRALLITLSIPLFIGFFQIANGTTLFLNGAFRVAGSFRTSPVGFALFLSGIGLLLLSQPKMSRISVLYFLVALGMTVATSSRQATVAFVLTTLLISFLQKRVGKLMVFLPFGIPILFLFPQIITQLWERLSQVLTINPLVLRRFSYGLSQAVWQVEGVDNSTLFRFKTLAVGLDVFRKSPIIGHGFGSFVINYELYTGIPNTAAHNDYLMYAVETGAIGLVFFLFIQLFIVLNLFRHFKRQSKETKFFTISTAGAYIAINVFCFLSNPYYFYEVQFWLWIAIGIALALIKKDVAKSITSENLSVAKE